MPQHTGWILEHPDISCNVSGIAFDHRSSPVVPAVSKESAKLGESCETPVALVCRESMVCCVCDVHARVFRVPEDQHELYAGVPVLGHLVLLVRLLEVERREVDIVAVGKEQYAPRLSAAFKDGAMLLPSERSPVSDLPCVVCLCLRLLVGELGQVLLHELIVLVGAGLGVGVDLVHLVIRIGGRDDGDFALLLVVLVVDEHVVAGLRRC